MDSKYKNFLEKEIDAFVDQLPGMMKNHPGKWTVFKDEKSLGFWHCAEDALAAGYEKYGNVPMLLRQVSEEYVYFGRLGEPVILSTPFIAY
jgi:hypothetical protein